MIQVIKRLTGNRSGLFLNVILNLKLESKITTAFLTRATVLILRISFPQDESPTNDLEYLIRL